MKEGTSGNTQIRQTGWRPIPLPLKTLSILIVLWAIGSVMNLPVLMKNGLPLLGHFIDGIPAALVAMLLDIIGPVVFLFALWKREHWGPTWAFTYIGFFILNGIVALFTVKDELGLAPILVPVVVSIAFVSIIFWKRDYFSQFPADKPE